MFKRLQLQQKESDDKLALKFSSATQLVSPSNSNLKNLLVIGLHSMHSDERAGRQVNSRPRDTSSVIRGNAVLEAAQDEAVLAEPGIEGATGLAWTEKQIHHGEWGRSEVPRHPDGRLDICLVANGYHGHVETAIPVTQVRNACDQHISRRDPKLRLQISAGAIRGHTR